MAYDVPSNQMNNATQHDINEANVNDDELDDAPADGAGEIVENTIRTEDEIRQQILENPPKGWLVLSPRRRRWGWLWNALTTIMVFILGMIAAMWLQTHPNLPLIAPVQQAVVDAGPIPSEVQSEFIAVMQAYRAIDKYFYGRLDGTPVDKKALVYGAGEELARQVKDPYTLYRAPEGSEGR